MRWRVFGRAGLLALGLVLAAPQGSDRAPGPGMAQAASLGELAQNYLQRQTGIFGATEIASEGFGPLPQWARVLDQTQLEQGTIRHCETGTAGCQEPWAIAWHDMLKKARGLPKRERVAYINKSFNYWPYRGDPEVYGVSEYWASPAEFMRRSGDCEDYSIAKYFALRALGFSPDEMRVVILYDQIRDMGHAVLAVYMDDDILILDSLSDRIFSHTRYRHYRPQYSMNESQRWAHGPV